MGRERLQRGKERAQQDDEHEGSSGTLCRCSSRLHGMGEWPAAGRLSSKRVHKGCRYTPTTHPPSFLHPPAPHLRSPNSESGGENTCVMHAASYTTGHKPPSGSCGCALSFNPPAPHLPQQRRSLYRRRVLRQESGPTGHLYRWELVGRTARQLGLKRCVQLMAQQQGGVCNWLAWRGRASVKWNGRGSK